MNTRSSYASSERHMTVDFSSRHVESTSCVVVSRSNVDVIAENWSGENDVKKTFDGLCNDNVDEEEENRRCKSDDQMFTGKEDSTFSCRVTTRSSSRPGKRPRTDSPQRSLSATPEPPKSGKTLMPRRRKAKKRQWESWGTKDKDCFFEALLEHSKDFDKIHNYLMKIHKRRGDLSSVVKNKDQVRHFYYRTLNKISKYIPEPKDQDSKDQDSKNQDSKNQDSNKTYHEVRSVICYGELRKKLHSLKEKDGKKLTELISTGKTMVRHHGRNLYIRAPVCRALKRLLVSNVVVDEPEHVPNKIMIELVPKDNKTWSTIQGLATNPRLRTTVSSRKSLYSLLTYLISKWKLCTNTNITLSPSLASSDSVSSKCNDLETVPPKNKLCDGSNDCVEEFERVSCDAVKDSCDTVCKVITETISVTTSNASNENKDANDEFECSGVPKQESTERIKIHNSLYQEKWDISNCSNFTVADVYRKCGRPRKVSLCYSLSNTGEQNVSTLLTHHALGHLVKLASGEFRNVSKLNKVSKSAIKPPKLAPKPPCQKPSLVIPSVVPSVLNQVSRSTSSKSGNHLAFGFTPINSFQTPSPFLPKMKKSRQSRVVVQRTLLPRPTTGVVNASPTGLGTSQSTDGMSSTQSSVTTLKESQSSSPAGEPQIQVMETNETCNGQDSAPYTQFTLPSSSSHNRASSEFSVDTLINLALEPNGNVEKLLSSKSVNHSSSSALSATPKNLFGSERNDGDVRTEEIDCGVAGGGRSQKEMSSLTEAIEHLDKESHSVEHTQDLLDNFRSAEDEYPFKLLSPTHNQQFHPETWINEEVSFQSSDFSLSNLFGNMEGSPTKPKSSNILDTPKKNQSDLKETECHDNRDNASKYLHPGQVFCDIVDESSVDYVKKFRDLAKKMKYDSETVSNSFDVANSLPSSSNTTVSFKALLSDATSRDCS